MDVFVILFHKIWLVKCAYKEKCIDCDEWFEVEMADNRTCRCKVCKIKERARINRENYKKRKFKTD